MRNRRGCAVIVTAEGGDSSEYNGATRIASIAVILKHYSKCFSLKGRELFVFRGKPKFSSRQPGLGDLLFFLSSVFHCSNTIDVFFSSREFRPDWWEGRGEVGGEIPLEERNFIDPHESGVTRYRGYRDERELAD